VLKRLLCFLFLLQVQGAVAESTPKVTIKTSVGDIVIELDAGAAPVTVENFLRYVEENSYDNTIFHRVIPGFMVQGGGHFADMSEASEREAIRNEADNGLKNRRGTVAMARSNQIDSAGRQFFINVDDNVFLDHSVASCTREDEKKMAEMRAKGLRKPATCKSFGYAVFGRVIAGMAIVDQIELSETRTVGPYNDVPVKPIVILGVDRASD
jgi:cyclophilin family peptidyl-prolyl cis-trans isomerase